MTWKRYRFLVFNPSYTWWCSGEAGDGSFVTIVAYLPADEPLDRYWDDAFDVDYTEEEAITFSDRSPEPTYYEDVAQ